jgi:hypothetical protein
MPIKPYEHRTVKVVFYGYIAIQSSYFVLRFCAPRRPAAARFTFSADDDEVEVT